MSEIVIENDGPIRKLRVPVPEGGGIVVLRGRNGSGKSTALEAVAALAGHDVKASHISIRDGQRKASVEGLGIRLTVAGRAQRSGELIFATIDRQPISKFVDPGHVNLETADEHRIRAILEIAQVPASIDLFREIMPSGVDVMTIVSAVTLAKENLVDMAGGVRSDLQKSARNAEDKANSSSTKAAVIKAGLPSGVQPAQMTPSQLEEVQRQAAEDLGAATQACSATQKEHKAYLAAVALLAEADVATQQERRSALTAEIGRIERRITDNKVLRDELAKRLAGVDADLSADASTLSTAVASLSQLERDQAGVTIAQGVVQQGEPDLTGAESRLGVARAKMTELTDSIIASREWEARMKKESEAEELRKAADAYENLAIKLREAADAVDNILSTAVSEYIPALQVHDRRLKIEYPQRGLIPFSELSHGEKWAVAIDFAGAAVGENGLLVIDQPAWEGLDNFNRDIAARAAEARKVHVFTAECSDDDDIICEQYTGVHYARDSHPGYDLQGVPATDGEAAGIAGDRESAAEGVAGTPAAESPAVRDSLPNVGD
jgi:energy-coupling factor transporter ATP-binding protein EcfA2